MERFYRTERLIGRERLAILRSSRIIVAGLGAVGSYALEALVRMGAENLLLIDHDTVSRSNINRQLYALESTVGRPKTEIAIERILDINPDAHVSALQLFMESSQTEYLLEWKPDIVIDAIDSLESKADMLAAVYHNNIAAVSSMGAALRTDPSMICTGDIFDTHGCPLAKKLRNLLRKRDTGRGITCVYSSERPDFEYRPPEEEEYTERNCNQESGRSLLGSIVTLTGIFGLRLAHLAMEKVTHT